MAWQDIGTVHCPRCGSFYRPSFESCGCAARFVPSTDAADLLRTQIYAAAQAVLSLTTGSFTADEGAVLKEALDIAIEDSAGVSSRRELYQQMDALQERLHQKPISRVADSLAVAATIAQFAGQPALAEEFLERIKTGRVDDLPDLCAL